MYCVARKYRGSLNVKVFVVCFGFFLLGFMSLCNPEGSFKCRCSDNRAPQQILQYSRILLKANNCLFFFLFWVANEQVCSTNTPVGGVLQCGRHLLLSPNSAHYAPISSHYPSAAESLSSLCYVSITSFFSAILLLQI